MTDGAHNTPEKVVYECAGTIRHGTLHNTTDTFEAVRDLVDEVMAHRAVVVAAVGSSSFELTTDEVITSVVYLPTIPFFFSSSPEEHPRIGQ